MRIVGSVLLAAAAVLVVPGAAQARAPLAARAAKAYGSPVTGGAKTTKVPIKVHVTGTRVTEVDVSVARAGGRGAGRIDDLKLASGTRADGIWTGTLLLTPEDLAGTYYIHVGATDGKQGDPYYAFGAFAKVGSFRVWRHTKLTVAAQPTPVKKGRKLLIIGGLTGRGTAKYQPLKRQTVEIYFRAKGAKKFTKVAVVHTNSKGRFSKSFKAKSDGQVKAVFPSAYPWAKQQTGAKKIDVV